MTLCLILPLRRDWEIHNTFTQFLTHSFSIPLTHNISLHLLFSCIRTTLTPSPSLSLSLSLSLWGTQSVIRTLFWMLCTFSCIYIQKLFILPVYPTMYIPEYLSFISFSLLHLISPTLLHIICLSNYLSVSLCRSLSRTLSSNPYLSHTHKHTHIHSQSFFCCFSHTDIYRLSHSYSVSHTHFSVSFSVSLCLSVFLSHTLASTNTCRVKILFILGGKTFQRHRYFLFH